MSDEQPADPTPDWAPSPSPAQDTDPTPPEVAEQDTSAGEGTTDVEAPADEKALLDDTATPQPRPTNTGPQDTL